MVQEALPQASASVLSLAYSFQQQLRQRRLQAEERSRWSQFALAGLAATGTGLLLVPVAFPVALPEAVLSPANRLGLGAVAVALVVVAIALLRVRQTHLALQSAEVAMDRALFFYRTVLQYRSDRQPWLSQETARIQQHLHPLLGGAWVGNPTAPETTPQPDLLPEDYLHQRLGAQLTQATQQAERLMQQRDRIQLGLVGLALVGGGVAVATPATGGVGAIALSIGVALVLWLRLTDLVGAIATQSQLALGLGLLRDHWQSLTATTLTGAEFLRLVVATEALLEAPYRQIADQIPISLGLLRDGEPDAIQQVLNQPPPALLVKELKAQSLAANPKPIISKPIAEEPAAKALRPDDTETLEATVIEPPTELIVSPPQTGNPGLSPAAMTAIKALPAAPPHFKQARRNRPHAFVIMPFGRKQGPDGKWIDFNSIYHGLIKPALEEAGFESFRADEEEASGDILTDMFQELLLADLAIADLSIDNANVFYELGIRHAFRKRGIVHIQAGRAYMPFDIFNVRTLPYHCDDNGCPDPQFLDKDKSALIKMVEATWKSNRNLVHSPVFNLLSGLPEPNRKDLRTPQATGYWQEYNALQSRIAIAQRQKRIGDVVLLAEEVSNPLVKEDILAAAGKALKSMGNSPLALKEYRQGLKLNPDNLTFRCEEAYHLSRLGQSDDAIVKLDKVLADHPTCVDATTYLARIYKDLWKQNWMHIADPDHRLQAAYEASFLLQRAIKNYLRGYRLDQNQYYPGINGLMLTALLDHLAHAAEAESGDADELAYRHHLPTLQGSVQFCLESTLHNDPNDYWAAMSLGDLAVCAAESPKAVATAYRKALAILWNNKFGLQSTLEQLTLLQLLDFRPAFVAAGIAVLQPEVERLSQVESLLPTPSDAARQPAQVFLFSGHMIDQPDRPKPRFPEAMEPEVSRRLEAVLDKFEVHPNCVAILPGLACGGDILFAEACLRRNLQIEVYLPFEPAVCIKDSVSFAGDAWVERFYQIINEPAVTVHLQIDRLGPVPKDDNPYERNNRWTLYSTLMYDISCVRLIALWNGLGGDGLGGTADLVQQVRQLGGIVEHLDITKFDYWQEGYRQESLQREEDLHATPAPVL